MPSKNLKVKIHEIPSAGLELEFNQDSKELAQVMADLVSQKPEFTVKFKLNNLEEMAQLTGEFSGSLPLVCSRCAEDFKLPILKNFSTLFYRRDDQIKTLPEISLDEPAHFDFEKLNSSELDLGEVIHEQIALEIPFQALCKEDCRGLCTQCGTNLNTEPCECVKVETVRLKDKSPFSALSLTNFKGESDGRPS